MPVRTFEYGCRFRYDEERQGDTKHGNGHHVIHGRCILSERDCAFRDKTNRDCPLSPDPKKKGGN